MEPVGEKKIVKGQLLPGVAGIAIYMLSVSLVGVVGVIRGQYPGAAAKYAVLPMCTLVVVGVFGLLRMRRWGWALVMAGTLMLSFGYAAMSRMTKNPAMMVMAALDLCLFLYLVRTEVRERMR
ncbi:hypothetical protein FTO74_03060 [Granulicella sp. WH15]|uniref:hypothetical protein n=1 Tax=Granulicella sp. WH15 TaxID=2602070 RepID=UPI0013669D44|nr:hypothetical protein [Granulicella sp. WH15]QHN02462.1 hypothetical protein FTO74_03060 [Granulicella sp. WH15]